MKRLLRLLPIIFSFVWVTLADDLANVSLNYCTTANNILQYQLTPGTETGICYTLSNGSKTPVTIKLWFIDGTFTNDQRQNKACLSDADTINFWQYVTGYDTLVTLQPGETLKKNAVLLYPVGRDGLYHGCVVYSVVQATKDTQSNNTSFSILMRRAKFIDVIVGNPQNAKERGIALDNFTADEGVNLSLNPKIRISKDDADGKYVIQIKVKNVSAVEQNVMITWVVSNILTYQNTFVESRKLLKGDSLVINQKLDAIPSYNLKVSLNISNTPFTFNNETPTIGMIKEHTIIWIWNTVTLLTILWILIIIWIIFLLIKDIMKRRNVSKVPAHTAHKHHKK